MLLGMLVMPVSQGVNASNFNCEKVGQTGYLFVEENNQIAALQQDIANINQIAKNQINAAQNILDSNPLNAAAQATYNTAVQIAESARNNQVTDKQEKIQLLEAQINYQKKLIRFGCEEYVPTEQFLSNNTPKFQGLSSVDSKGNVILNGIERGSNIQRDQIQEISTSGNLPQLIIGWVQLTGQIVAILAVMIIVYAGYLVIIQWTDPNSRLKGFKIIGWVSFGVIMVFAAYPFVIMIVQALFGELNISPNG